MHFDPSTWISLLFFLPYFPPIFQCHVCFCPLSPLSVICVTMGVGPSMGSHSGLTSKGKLTLPPPRAISCQLVWGELHEPLLIYAGVSAGLIMCRPWSSSPTTVRSCMQWCYHVWQILVCWRCSTTLPLRIFPPLLLRWTPSQGWGEGGECLCLYLSLWLTLYYISLYDPLSKLYHVLIERLAAFLITEFDKNTM